MLPETLQIYSVKITANTFVSQKIESLIFTRAPNQNSPPGFDHYPPGRRELPILMEHHFLKIFFPERGRGGEGRGGERIMERKGEGERIMELKKLPKLTKASVTNFNKFHHLCNLYIFGLYFVVQ